MQNPLVIMKRTKFELDMEKYQDLDYYKRICNIENDCFEKVFSSHERQIESRKKLIQTFPEAKFIFRKEIESIEIQKFNLIIALGGDNHFTYVAHHFPEYLIAGCNSDTRTSVGALLSFNPDSLVQSFHKNWEDTKTEEWTLVFAEIEYPNGEKINTVKSVNEISVRNSNPDLTSRFILNYNGIIEEQKCSGLLIYTGAGSTGWYRSCKLESEEEEPFPRNSDYFKVYSRELSRKARQGSKLSDFQVKGSLTVISEMDGGISVDSLAERVYSFPPGAIARFQLSNKKLKVLIKEAI